MRTEGTSDAIAQTHGLHEHAIGAETAGMMETIGIEGHTLGVGPDTSRLKSWSG